MNDKKLDSHAKYTSCIVAGICVVFSLVLLMLPKSDWSENENRQLQTFPKFSFESLANGEYLSDLDDYLTDHFPLRDVFVSLNTRCNMLLGQREINSVYICDNDFLIDKYQTPVRTDKILEAFNRLPGAVGDRNVTLLIAPTAVTVYDDYLPPFAQCADQMETLGQYYSGFSGTTVDVTPTLLEHKDEQQLYYRTDHHWTTWGAYYAYVELCGTLGLQAIPAEAFEITCVTEDFCGTTYSKVNDFSLPGEQILRFSLPGQTLTVAYGMPDSASVSAAPGSDGLYNPDYLEQKDKYSYFLDNIHEFISIENPNAQTDRELVVIKDSYANCFIPFLTEHFKRVYVIDPRYYRDSVIDFINSQEAVTDVLVLYNLGTMDSDNGATVIF